MNPLKLPSQLFLILFALFFCSKAFATPCTSADDWQFLASDPINHLEIRYKILSSQNTRWGVMNNSTSNIVDVSVGKKKYWFADGHESSGSAEQAGGGTTASGDCSRTIADPLALTADEHGDIVRLGMHVCEISWLDEVGTRHHWAGNGCNGGSGPGPVESGGSSSGGGDGGSSSSSSSGGTPPQPTGGILSKVGEQIIDVSGEVGGPFNTPNGYLDISNTGDQSLFYNVNNPAQHVRVEPLSGTLSPGQTKRLQMSLTDAVNDWSEGTFYPNFNVKNITNNKGSASWVGIVNVLPSTKFIVSQGNFDSYRVLSLDTGFTPDTKQYTIENGSNSNINFTIDSDKNWLGISPASGTLAPGASTNITVSLNGNASALGSPGHTALINFTDTTNGIRVKRQANLSIFDEVSQLQVTPNDAFELVDIIGYPQQNNRHQFAISNPGGPAINYRLTTDVDWMSIIIDGNRLEGQEITKTLFSTHADSVVVSAAYNNNLAIGTYTGVITVEDLLNPTSSYTIPVTLVKREANAGTISVSPLNPININFESNSGGGNEYIKAFEIKNYGETSFDYTVTSDQNWARVYRLTDIDNTTPGGDVILIPVSGKKSPIAPSQSSVSYSCPCDIPATGTLPPNAGAIIYVWIRVSEGFLEQGGSVANINFTNTTNGQGSSTVPITINRVDSTLPKMPENVQVTRFGDINRLRWDIDYSNVQSYEIQHATDGTNFTSTGDNVNARQRTPFERSLNDIQNAFFNEPGGYSYRIRACNLFGCGPFSPAVRAPIDNKLLSTGTLYDSIPESTTIVATQGLYSDRIRVRWSHYNDSTKPSSYFRNRDEFQLFRSTSPTGPKTQIPSDSFTLPGGQAIEPTGSGYFYYWDTDVQSGQDYYYWVKQCYRMELSSPLECDPDFSFYAEGFTYKTPANLVAAPATSLNASIEEGAIAGLPDTMQILIQNTGMLAASWTLSADQNWLTLAQTSGVIAGGAKQIIDFNINNTIQNFIPGSYNANIELLNTTNSFGNTNFQVGLNVAAAPIPSASGGVSASLAYYSNRIELEWQAVTGATFYNIARSGDNQQTENFLATGTQFSDVTALEDIIYTYEITACNSTGCSSAISTQGQRINDDTDADGVNNNFDPDDDNDGVSDDWDKFPFDPTESLDNDGDGIGDAADLDDDQDLVPDTEDAFPFNASESADNDMDGIGDNADTDDDNDGIPDTEDENPFEFTDALAPQLFEPSDITTNATGELTEVDLGEATALDNLDPTPTITNDYQGPLPTGAHTITWRATDEDGNVATATQSVWIQPLIELPETMQVSEGETITIPVTLSGIAPAYPVQIPFYFEGSAVEGEDYQLIGENYALSIDSGISGEIQIETLNDALIENEESIRLIIDDEVINAGLLENTFVDIEISQDNIAPFVKIRSQQNSQTTRTIVIDQGNVTLQAVVRDLNSNDQHTIDWHLTDDRLSDLNIEDEDFTFDPSNLTVGEYLIGLTVTDDKGGEVSLQMPILILAAPQSLSLVDSDGDGLNDNVEGGGDEDEDGLPDFLDRTNDKNLLQASLNSNSNLQTNSNYHLLLGDTAFAIGETGAWLSEEALRDYLNDTYQENELSLFGGIYDFNIENLAYAGETVSVVIPLTEALPENANYQKYDINNGWLNFIIDANNTIKSAPGQSENCPAPGHSDYSIGLSEGYFCIELSIEDGGPNDADGIANGFVKDPGGVFSISEVTNPEPSEDEAPEEPVEDNEPDLGNDEPPRPPSQSPSTPTISSSSSSSGSGGGGSIGIFGLFMLIIVSFIASTNRRRFAGKKSI